MMHQEGDMIRRNWTRLLVAGITGATLIGVFTGLFPMGYGLLIFSGSMYSVWLVWGLTRKPKVLAPIWTLIVLALLGWYASYCFPVFGTGPGWCL